MDSVPTTLSDGKKSKKIKVKKPLNFQMSTNNSLFSVAETYAQMYKTSDSKVERPRWVPSTIAEEHVNEFVDIVREARSSKINVVEFKGKKYVIREEDPEQQAQELKTVTKDLPVEGDDAKEIKHANVAAAQAAGDKPKEIEEEDELVGNQKKLDVNNNGKIDADDLEKLRAGKKANDILEEEEAEIQAANVTDKRSSDDPMHTLPMMAEEDDDADEDDADEDDADEDDSDEDTETMNEGEEEKYYSTGDNPMSRERRTHEYDNRGSAPRYGSPQAREHARVAAAATGSAIEASRRALSGTKAAHVTAADKHDEAAGKYSLNSHHYEYHKNAAKDHRAAAVKESVDQVAHTNEKDSPGVMARSAKDDYNGEDDTDYNDDWDEGEDYPLEEKLTSRDPAGKWIHDFVKSKNPRFAGKSKEQRKKMALGAYYSAQREATEYQPGLSQMLSVANTYAQMGKAELTEGVASKELKNKHLALLKHHHDQAAYHHDLYKVAIKHGRDKESKDHDSAKTSHENSADYHTQSAVEHGANYAEIEKHAPYHYQTESVMKKSNKNLKVITEASFESDAVKEDLTEANAPSMAYTQSSLKKASDAADNAGGLADHTGSPYHHELAHHHHMIAYLKHKHADVGVSDMDYHSAEAKRHLAAASKSSVKEGVIKENIAGDPHATMLSTNANQASAMAHASPNPETPENANEHQAAARAHNMAAQHYRVYAQHAADPVLKSVAQIHHKFHDDMHNHHLLRSVQFSESTESVKEGTQNDSKAGPEVMDKGTARMRDGHRSVKVEDRFNVGAAQDGAEKIMPSDAPKVNAKAGDETPSEPTPELETPKSSVTGSEKLKKASLPATGDTKVDIKDPVIKNPTGAENITQAPYNKAGK